ncbi:MAG: DUF1571 domain-containing protein [Sedimentisphaerales bacterium]|nr:DUF1571 domain-containing protein [Sedimentisphaerales bacterium]
MSRITKLTRLTLWPRLLVGTMLGLFLLHGFGGNEQQSALIPPSIVLQAQAISVVPGEIDTPAAHLLQLSQTDHIALLEWAVQRYEQQVQDYRVNFEKQERINNELKPAQIISVNFKEEPFSVLMNWESKGGPIDKLLFVEGQNDDMMLVHPAGLLGFIKSVKKDPTSEEVRRSSRGTPDQFGFYRCMQSLLKVYRQAQENGDLETACLGQTEVDGRACLAIERRLPAGKDYPCARLILEIDQEYIVPTRISMYDWQDNLLCIYEYKDIEFNVGLADVAFTPKANNL